MSLDDLGLVKIYRIFEKKFVDLQCPSSVKTDWMDNTQERFAYRCLPMAISNSLGWVALAPNSVRIKWSGGIHKDDLVVENIDSDQGYSFASSLFGHGVVTFHFDFIIKTPQEISIEVLGPPNRIKDGIQPLSGVVETFWLPFTFTMNWKMTRPGEVFFEKNEPVMYVRPIRISDYENMNISEEDIKSDSTFYMQYLEYSNSRTNFIEKTNNNGWQKNYLKGVCPFSNKPAKGHKVKINPVSKKQFN